MSRLHCACAHISRCLLEIDRLRASSKPSQPLGIKLPKITMPRFSGQRGQFNSYWQMYENTIEKSTISDVEKFNYLRSTLDGPALKSIQGLSITAENYPSAKKRNGLVTLESLLRSTSRNFLLPIQCTMPMYETYKRCMIS